MPRVAHAVFFTLRDHSTEAKDRLVRSCDERLRKIAGIETFAAGKRAIEFDRDVNDDSFDVGLLIVFASKEAHDAYQTSVEHQVFVAEIRETVASVRVFDTYVV